MKTKRTISANGNPFADDVTVAPAETVYDWRTDTDYDAVEVEVARMTFNLDREQAMHLGLALVNAANYDEPSACTDAFELAEMEQEMRLATDEDAYYDSLVEQWEEEQDAKADLMSAHWGHD